MILALGIVGTVGVLLIRFKETMTKKQHALKEPAVLILSTREPSNVPMVIASTGESERVSALPISIELAWHNVTWPPLIGVVSIT